MEEETLAAVETVVVVMGGMVMWHWHGGSSVGRDDALTQQGEVVLVGSRGSC